MQKHRVGVAVGALVIPAMMAGLLPANAAYEHDVVVSANPADWTPDVENTGFGDGVNAAKVRATATVGDITVAVGDFTTVREKGSSSTVARSDIFAFDSQGRVLESFAPDFNGSSLFDVIPAGDGKSVFVAGAYSQVDGQPRTARLVKLDATTGQVDTSFKSPGFSNRTVALHLANGRLYVAGAFERVGGGPRTALVALDPETGDDTGHVDLTFSDTWNGGTLGITAFTMTPDGSRLVAVGNFRNVDGQSRPQIAMIDTSGPQAVLDSWATTRYSTNCHRRFDTYMYDVDSSPDGSYFVAVTTGAYSGGIGSGTLCDTTARWDFGRTGAGQHPTWINYSGGDTVTAVEVTGEAIYIGGHFRWTNNPYAGDRRGPGAIPRKGIAALDPRNGMPLSWNPGRLRGWGVYGFRSTDQGLWVGHDTEEIGDEPHKRLALMPLVGGSALPPDDTGSLPGNVVLLGKRTGDAEPSPILYRVNAGGSYIPALDDGPDWAQDLSTAPSPHHNTGSNTASWATLAFTRAPGLPAETPTSVFSAERWDPSSAPTMQWDFPAEAGVPLEVRLYFANGCSCTRNPGQRKFDVFVDDALVLDDYDIVADVGNQVGTMKAFRVVSDGNVDIDFAHVLENPMVNAIEIVRTDIVQGPVDNDRVFMNEFSGSAVSASSEMDSGGVDWSSVRGAFMVDGMLFTGWSDGTMTRRVFNGTRFGNPVPVNLFDLAPFENELPSIRGMWFDRETGRMYFTMAGSNRLFYRYFTPENRAVGAVRFEAPTSSGVDWSSVTGGFLTGDSLYYRTADGNLHAAGWSAAGVASGGTVVSGPSLDGTDWNARGMFLEAR